MAAAALSSMQTLDVNGLRMQVVAQGSGPPVLLCHGLPELRISWRAQLEALAAAGRFTVGLQPHCAPREPHPGEGNDAF